MPSAPMVSSEQVTAVIDRYADRVADLVQRLECPPQAVIQVVQRSGAALVESAAREPERIGDLLGRWVADARRLTVRLRAEVGATGSGQTAAAPAEGTGPATAGDPEVAATETALAGLDERRRVALLLRDSYDATHAAIAIALGFSLAEAETIVADARLRLIERRDGGPLPSLAGHAPLAGITLGRLGAMADGGIPTADADPGVRAQRRHVGGCEICAAVLSGETRARSLLVSLPIRGLPAEARAGLVTGLSERAAQLLPTEADIVEIVEAPVRVFPRWVVPAALAGAIAIGAAIGGIAAAGRSDSGGTPSPTDTGIVVPSDSATASPTATATGSPSPSASGAPTSAPTQVAPPSVRPSRTPSRRPSLRPTRRPPASSPASTAPSPSAEPSLPASIPASETASPSGAPASSQVSLSPSAPFPTR